MKKSACLLWLVPFALVLQIAGCSKEAANSGDELARARALLQDTILIDGHNDLPALLRDIPGGVDAYDMRGTTSGDTDLQRLRDGGVGAQFWSVYIPGELKSGYARNQLEQIDIARRLIERYPDTFQFAGTAADIRAAKRAGKIASLMGIEGGHAIENSLGVLRSYYDLGVRYMTLTHNTHTDWADSAAEVPARHNGLNTLGEQIVHEMNRIGMLVDLSHTSEDTTQDVLRISRAPVIFSHSATKAICDVPRNVSDLSLRLLKANGGVLMVTFVAGFIDPAVAEVMQPAIERYNALAKSAATDEERAGLFDSILGALEMPPTSVAVVADHIEHIRGLIGVEHIGIGGDFDGNSWWPDGLSDVSMYPNLFAELIRRGWTEADLKAIAGENVLRVMEQAEQVAAAMQGEQSATGVTD